jgi:hypothetical protein
MPGDGYINASHMSAAITAANDYTTYVVRNAGLTWANASGAGTGDTIITAFNDNLATAIVRAWQQINAAASSYIITASNNAASAWIDASGSAATVTWTGASAAMYTHDSILVPVPQTPAQREAERVRIAAVREAEDTARARAEELLDRYLTLEQRVTLRERNWFLVVSRSGTRYRIYRGRSHNVKLLDAADREVASLCAHPQMVVPEADCMLSQKLMLELAEDRFLAIANKRHLMSDRRMAA